MMDRTMYIKTQNKGIINTLHFDRIDVYKESDDSYSIRAYTNPIPNSIDHESIAIAKFDKREDAYNSFLNLWNSLMSQAKTWSPDAVNCFSEMWQKVIDLEIEKNSDEFVESLKVEIIALNSFMITHPTKYVSDSAKLNDLKMSVAESMEQVFGLEPIITWEDEDDEDESTE